MHLSEAKSLIREHIFSDPADPGSSLVRHIIVVVMILSLQETATVYQNLEMA